MTPLQEFLQEFGLGLIEGRAIQGVVAVMVDSHPVEAPLEERILLTQGLDPLTLRIPIHGSF